MGQHAARAESLGAESSCEDASRGQAPVCGPGLPSVQAVRRWWRTVPVSRLCVALRLRGFSSDRRRIFRSCLAAVVDGVETSRNRVSGIDTSRKTAQRT